MCVPLLKKNPRWWGWSEKRSGNVDEVDWLTIRSDATRLAALISGEVEMVLDPPIPDVARLKGEGALKLVQTEDLGEQFLVFDVTRPELDGSDVKGRNPFKDLRVRQAVYHAINVDLIAKKVLRGLAVADRCLPFESRRRRAARDGPPTAASIRPGPRPCWPRPGTRTVFR